MKLPAVGRVATRLTHFLRGSLLPRWRLIIIVCILAWVLLAVQAAADSGADRDQPRRTINPENVEYLQVQLGIPSFDPSKGSITLAVSCWLPEDTRQAVAQALDPNNDWLYDVRLLELAPGESARSIGFQQPPQSGGTSLSIAIFATGFSGDTVADETQISSGIATSSPSVTVPKDVRQSPFDTYELRLMFAMAVPPGLNLDSTQDTFNAGDTMPCMFIVDQVDGSYRYSIEAEGNSVLRLHIYRDRDFIKLAWTLVFAMPMLVLLLASWPEPGAWMGRVGATIVIGAMTWMRLLVLPEGIPNAFTRYDRYLVLSFVVSVILLAIAGAAGAKSQKKT